MTKPKTLALMVVAAHWMVAIWHLFLAARILPGPNNNVSGLAITLISLGHLCVLTALWKLGDKLAGLVALVFFLAALSADLYEHFLHAAANNVLTLAAGDGTGLFDASVFALVVLEVLACSLGILLLSGWAKPREAM